MLGPTWPNRLYHMSAYTVADAISGGPGTSALNSKPQGIAFVQVPATP